MVRPKRSLYLKRHEFLSSALEHAVEVPEGLIERLRHSREAAVASGSFVDVADQLTR